MGSPLFEVSQGTGSALSNLASQDQAPKVVSFLAHHSDQDTQRTPGVFANQSRRLHGK